VGHKIKIHKVTPTTGREWGDLEIKDCVVLQKHQEKADRLPPPRTLILDFTLTHPHCDGFSLELGPLVSSSKKEREKRKKDIDFPLIIVSGQHVLQVCNTTDYFEYRRCTYSF
jgi:hypothetical protein